MRERPGARLLAALALWLLAAGCGGWKQVTVSPTALDQEQAKLRLTLPDGQRVMVSQARLVRDSIVGTIHGHDTTVALTDVQRMAVRAPDPERAAATGTFWVAALVTFVGIWAGFILVNRSS